METPPTTILNREHDCRSQGYLFRLQDPPVIPAEPFAPFYYLSAACRHCAAKEGQRQLGERVLAESPLELRN